jgi:hypothetical protein
VDICLFGNIKQKNLDEHLLKHRTGIDKEHMKNVDITKSNLGFLILLSSLFVFSQFRSLLGAFSFVILN